MQVRSFGNWHVANEYTEYWVMVALILCSYWTGIKQTSTEPKQATTLIERNPTGKESGWFPFPRWWLKKYKFLGLRVLYCSFVVFLAFCQRSTQKPQIAIKSQSFAGKRYQVCKLSCLYHLPWVRDVFEFLLSTLIMPCGYVTQWKKRNQLRDGQLESYMGEEGGV